MALVSAFLVVSVTVILVRVKPIVESRVQAAGAAAIVAAPRDFTLATPKSTTSSPSRPIAVRLARMDETTRWNYRWPLAKHAPHYPSPRASVTGAEIGEEYRWAPMGETRAADLPRASSDGPQTTSATAATSQQSSQGSQSYPITRIDDTYADEVSTSTLGT
ncbi:hypothetical protein MTO96_036613 [Rhipicephalus appendiculatus]